MAEILNSSEAADTSATSVFGKSIKTQTSEIIKTLNIKALLNSIKENDSKSVPVYLQFKDSKRKYKPVKYACLRTACMMVLLPDDLKGSERSDDDLELASLYVQTSRTQEIIPEQKQSISCKEKSSSSFQAGHPKPTNGLSQCLNCGCMNKWNDTQNEKYLELPQACDTDDVTDKNHRFCESDSSSFFSYTSGQTMKGKGEGHLQNQQLIDISKNEDMLNSRFQLTPFKSQDTQGLRNNEKSRGRAKHKGISYVPCTDDRDSKRLSRFPARFKKHNKDNAPLKSASENIVSSYNKDAVDVRAVKSERHSNACKVNTGISRIAKMKHGCDRVGDDEERNEKLGAIPGFSFKLHESDLKVNSNSTVIDEDCLIKIQEEQRYLQPFTITMNEFVNNPLKIYEVSSIKQNMLFAS